MPHPSVQTRPRKKRPSHHTPPLGLVLEEVVATITLWQVTLVYENRTSETRLVRKVYNVLGEKLSHSGPSLWARGKTTQENSINYRNCGRLRGLAQLSYRFSRERLRGQHRCLHESSQRRGKNRNLEVQLNILSVCLSLSLSN